MVLPLLASALNTTESHTLYQWQGGADMSPVKAVPLVVHGLGGCLAWMEPFIEALNQHYPVVTGLDINHYGPSETQVGHIPNRQVLLGIIQQGIQSVYERYNQPVLLIGLSLGGLLVTHALARSTYRQPVAGVVLVSPAFKASARSFRPKTYAQVLLRSWVTRSSTPIGLPYDITGVTSDVTQQSRLREAKGCVTSMTAPSFLELLKLTLSRRQFNQLDYPLLMMRAHDDHICDTQAMDAEWKRWPNPQKQLMIFANVKHDLVLEPVNRHMATVIKDWQHRLV
jgi:alpha-beta hydrolase superfamily lysophospholipase